MRDRLRRALPEAARLPASSGGRPPRWNWPCSVTSSLAQRSCANSTVKPSRWRNWLRSHASSTSSSISRIRNRQPLFANLARHRRIHTLLYTHLQVAAWRFKAFVRLACRGDTAAKDWVAVPFHVFLECSETLWRHRLRGRASYRRSPASCGREHDPVSVPGSVPKRVPRPAGITTIQAGFPLSPGINIDSCVCGNNANRPNVLRNPNLDTSARKLNKWFDVDAFAAPAQYTIGNAGRGLIWGPGTKNFDLEIGKRFSLSKLREGASLQFRGEFYNIMNSPYFDNPNVTLGSSTFGRITNVSNSPRQAQLALKLIF